MLMALIALYARYTGRTYAASRALLFVILLMLLWNPLYLAFDPGFSLSVAATAGLIWLAPILERFLQERGGLHFLRVMPSAAQRNALKNAIFERPSFWINAIATTLSAQIAVLPLLLYFTGNLSFIAIPANVFVMPFVPLAMAWSFVAGIGGMLFAHFVPLLAIGIGFPAYLLNAFLMFVAQTSAALPYATFLLPAFPFWLVLVVYAALMYFIARSNRSSITPQFILAKNAST